MSVLFVLNAAILLYFFLLIIGWFSVVASVVLPQFVQSPLSLIIGWFSVATGRSSSLSRFFFFFFSFPH